jgi:myo-inositol-1(or 4)-monophosphatase
MSYSQFLASQDQLSTFLDIALCAAQGGGVVLQEFWGKQLAIAQKSRPGDLVTEVDQKAEQEILTVIQRHFPEHLILAEESGKIGELPSDYLWVIDPLDGTTNYAHGYPQVAVSIGLLIKGIPAVGVVYNPILNELWSAAQGLGATLNQREINVSPTKELSNSLLVTGFAYDRRETRDNNYAEFCHLTHLTQGVRRSGSAALDLTHVACGRFDGYWERGIKPWDIIAGIVILTEAGGKVSAYDGSKIDFDKGRILATNGHIHDLLSQVLLKTTQLPESFAVS